MLFLSHITFGIDLIALALAVKLVVWGMKNPGEGSGLAKFFGWIIIVLAIISLVCAGYTSTKKWQYMKDRMEYKQEMMKSDTMDNSKESTKAKEKKSARNSD